MSDAPELNALKAIIDEFDDEVAQQLAEGERADLWTDVEVPVSLLRALLAALREVPVAWRVVTNNTAWSFYCTREEAEHGAKNRLAYVKGCTSARIEPLYASPASHGVVEALREIRAAFDVEYHEDGRIASVGHASDGLRKMVNILDAALAPALVEPQGVDGWQTMDTAPKDGSTLWVLDTLYGKPWHYECIWNGIQWYHGFGESWPEANPSRWRPRPAAPEQEKANG